MIHTALSPFLEKIVDTFVRITKGQFQIKASAKTRFKVNSLNIHGFVLSQYLKPLKEHSFM